MMGERVDEKEQQHHHHPNSMFAKLHQTHKFQQPPPMTHQHHIKHLQVTRNCETPEEAAGINPAHAAGTTTRSTTTRRALPPSTITTSADGATIEVVRRPRGRPPGSKNKPKAPVIITSESEPSMCAYVFELPGGVDIVDSVTRFCRKRSMGLSVLTGSGTVENVTLRQASETPGATVTFHGRFEILSVSATILPSSMDSVAATVNGFTICLAGPQGQVVGGSVVGTLLSAGTVYLIASSFNRPSFHRLPLEDEVGSSGSGGNDGQQQQSPSTVSGTGGGDPAAAAVSFGVSIYGSHLPSDVIWAPTARQPTTTPRY